MNETTTTMITPIFGVENGNGIGTIFHSLTL
jgi:hypothetical protein